jgi:hypothetical protein
MGLILENKESLVHISQENMGSDLILESLVLPKTALLILRLTLLRKKNQLPFS